MAGNNTGDLIKGLKEELAGLREEVKANHEILMESLVGSPNGSTKGLQERVKLLELYMHGLGAGLLMIGGALLGFVKGMFNGRV